MAIAWTRQERALIREAREVKERALAQFRQGEEEVLSKLDEIGYERRDDMPSNAHTETMRKRLREELNALELRRFALEATKPKLLRERSGKGMVTKVAFITSFGIPIIPQGLQYILGEGGKRELFLAARGVKGKDYREWLGSALAQALVDMEFPPEPPNLVEKSRQARLRRAAATGKSIRVRYKMPALGKSFRHPFLYAPVRTSSLKVRQARLK